VFSPTAISCAKSGAQNPRNTANISAFTSLISVRKSKPTPPNLASSRLNRESDTASKRRNRTPSPRAAAETIVDAAATVGASRLILGAPKRNALINLLRGNVIREVSNSLPEEIDLLVYA
jgi:hypothetical protein